MLVKNQYDGRLYEVPYGPVNGYGEYAESGYQRLGLPFFGPLAAKFGARLARRFMPKALPFARRLLRRVMPRIPGITFPGFPGIPVAAGSPAVPVGRLSTNVAHKVVAMLRQQGYQVTPASAPQPEPAAEAGPLEPQPRVGEYGGPRDHRSSATRRSPAALPRRAPPGRPSHLFRRMTPRWGMRRSLYPFSVQQYPLPVAQYPLPGAQYPFPGAQYPFPGAEYPGTETQDPYPPGMAPGSEMPMQPGIPTPPGVPFARPGFSPFPAYRRRWYRRRR
jgi:hypothetical protein